jgi:hypothetical protein
MKRKLKALRCTLCSNIADNFEITGVKALAEKKQIPYQLCLNCCKELHSLSFYSPLQVKKRREFWENVWAQLN